MPQSHESLSVAPTPQKPSGCPKAPDGDPTHDPREKLLWRGPPALSASELVALLIGNRPTPEEALRTATALLHRHGFERLPNLTLSECRERYGVGPAGAGRLVAALELHRRLRRAEERDAPKVSSPRDAAALLPELRAARREHLVALYLDAQNVLIVKETISMGSLNTTRTHPREILHPAIQHLAVGFVLAHNHPSGSLVPSVDDAEFTRSVGRAGELIGIELYDHVIVSSKGYVSLKEKGLL